MLRHHEISTAREIPQIGPRMVERDNADRYKDSLSRSFDPSLSRTANRTVIEAQIEALSFLNTPCREALRDPCPRYGLKPNV